MREYIAARSRRGDWATQFELVTSITALQPCVGKFIIRLYVRGGRCYTVGDSDEDLNPQCRVVHLAYDGQHFDFLRPKGSDEGSNVHDIIDTSHEVSDVSLCEHAHDKYQ